LASSGENAAIVLLCLSKNRQGGVHVADEIHLEIGSLLFEGVDQIDLTGPYEVLSRIPNSTYRIYGKTAAVRRRASERTHGGEITIRRHRTDAQSSPWRISKKEAPQRLNQDRSELSFSFSLRPRVQAVSGPCSSCD
jgi:hypothetical protein